MIISNKQYALSKLEHINYYRLSAYFLPYQYKKDSSNANQFLADTTFEDIIKEKGRSKEVFIKHFQEKYNSSDLPIWSVVEIISFGSLSKLFMLLQESEQNSVIANMGNINKVVFFKWFKALSSVRNVCAHYGRLWNKTLGVGFEVPRNNPKFILLPSSAKKVFFALSVIEYILTCIGEDEIDFKNKIKQLLQRYSNIDKQAMGFINNWENLEIWKV